MNTCVQVFVNIFSFLLGRYLGVELLSYRLGSCLTSLETTRQVPFSPAVYQRGFQLFHILADFCCYSLFNFSPNGCDVMPYFFYFKDIYKNFQACQSMPAETLKRSYRRGSQVLHFSRQKVSAHLPIPEVESLQPLGLSTDCFRATSKPEPQRAQAEQEKEAGQSLRVERGGASPAWEDQNHTDSQSQGKLWCTLADMAKNLTCK